jgi:hypothetical protein
LLLAAVDDAETSALFRAAVFSGVAFTALPSCRRGTPTPLAGAADDDDAAL